MTSYNEILNILYQRLPLELCYTVMRYVEHPTATVIKQYRHYLKQVWYPWDGEKISTLNRVTVAIDSFNEHQMLINEEEVEEWENPNDPLGFIRGHTPNPNRYFTKILPTGRSIAEFNEWEVVMDDLRSYHFHKNRDYYPFELDSDDELVGLKAIHYTNHIYCERCGEEDIDGTYLSMWYEDGKNYPWCQICYDNHFDDECV